MSFLLNGEKMRQRLAQLLAQAREQEPGDDRKHDDQPILAIPRVSTID